jgi:hypothetical protein
VRELRESQSIVGTTATRQCLHQLEQWHEFLRLMGSQTGCPTRPVREAGVRLAKALGHDGCLAALIYLPVTMTSLPAFF